MPHVLAWDIEVPDLSGYAAANGLEGKNGTNSPVEHYTAVTR